jgi:hypothetical protein
MPIRQHPLLRYYAKATSVIPLSWLYGSDFPSRKDLTRVCLMAGDEMPPFPPGEDFRHDNIRMQLECVAEGGHPDGGSLRVQARRAAGLLADYVTQLALMGTKYRVRSYPGQCSATSPTDSQTR